MKKWDLAYVKNLGEQLTCRNWHPEESEPHFDEDGYYLYMCNTALYTFIICISLQLYNTALYVFLCGTTAQLGPRPPSFQGF